MIGVQQGSRQDYSKTILVIVVGFLAAYFLTDWDAALVVSLIVGLIGIVSPYLSRKIEQLWLKLSWVLSLIVPNILLTIVFFLILFPVALISRSLRKERPIALRKPLDSLWVDVEKEFDGESMRNPW